MNTNWLNIFSTKKMYASTKCMYKHWTDHSKRFKSLLKISSFKLYIWSNINDNNTNDIKSKRVVFTLSRQERRMKMLIYKNAIFIRFYTVMSSNGSYRLSRFIGKVESVQIFIIFFIKFHRNEPKTKIIK